MRERRTALELRDYLRVLRKGWALILAFVIVGIALGAALTIATTKIYRASSQVFVSVSAALSAQGAANSSNYITQRVQSYVSIATSPAVTGPVITDLNLPLNNQQLANKITADAPTGKVLINLHVNDHSPEQAAKIANALAVQFDLVVEKTEQQDATTPSLVKLTVIHPATVPSVPVTPSKTLNIGLGLVLGLLIGVGVAVLREVLDSTVKGARDFEELGVPVLGNVPFDKRTGKTPIAFRGDPHSARSEAYRQIRTNLQFVDVDNPPRIIAVTSAVPGEGKSTSAINLAAALAEAGARVCLVEADLRRPSIARVLGLVGDVGFTTVVIGKAPVETVLQNAGRNLAVLTSGPIPPNPSELLLSKHAKQVIYDIAAKVDFTIIDTPPLLPVTDGAEIATLADATILVHRASKTTREQVVRSVEALAKVGQRPVGVIINMITRSSSKYDNEYGYYYEAYRPNADAKGRGRKREKGESSAAGSYSDDDFTRTLTGNVETAAVPTAEPVAEPTPSEDGSTRSSRRRRGKRGQAEATATETQAGAPVVPVAPTPLRYTGETRGPGHTPGGPFGGPFGGPVMPGTTGGQQPSVAVPVPVVNTPGPANYGYTYPTESGQAATGERQYEDPSAVEPAPPTPLWFQNDQHRP